MHHVHTCVVCATTGAIVISIVACICLFYTLTVTLSVQSMCVRTSTIVLCLSSLCTGAEGSWGAEELSTNVTSRDS